jgi:hypothetical protein
MGSHPKAFEMTRDRVVDPPHFRRRMGKQGSLFEMPIVRPYSTMRNAHLESLGEDVARTLTQSTVLLRSGNWLQK